MRRSLIGLVLLVILTTTGWILYAETMDSGPLPVVPSLQQTDCTGHGDTKAGCPADPAPWICTPHGKGGTHVCDCKQVCSLEEDGSMTISESSVCKRWCKKSACDCHPEEECPKG